MRDPATAAVLQPQYRYLCKRPCFHDGFLGGKTDEVMMRIVDVLYSLPFIFFVISSE